MKNLHLKLSLLTLALLALCNSSISAQTTERIDTKKLKLGVFVAPNISWMHPTTNKSDNGEYATSSQGSKMGFTYGMMLDYNFAANYAIVSGLQVNMTGGKILANRLDKSFQTSTINKADFAYNLSYLEIPLAIKLKSNDISGFRFFGQAGITLGFNIAKKANYTVDFTNATGNASTVSEEREKIKGTLAIAPIMLQMNLGAGAEYDLGQNLKGYAGIFFNNGFLPDATKPNNYKMGAYDNLPFTDGNVRLNSLSLRIGIFF